jgi:3-hydroxybutyryl-CoA dehydratase
VTLKKGLVVEWRRSFTEEDIAAFAELSGDKGRHHLERDAAGRLMAHGLLTATLPTKLGGDLDYIAASMTFDFKRPVYAGEELLCRGKVTSVRKEKDRLAVTFSFVVTNPRGKTVLEGRTKGIIREKEAPAPPAPPPAAAPAAPSRDRGEFMRSAPQARESLVAGLKPLLAKAAALTADERDVLAHILAYAGYGEDGHLRVPSFATLWGEAPSYVPAVRLEPQRVAAAVRLLRRRGVLRPTDHDVLLDDAALRALSV